MIPNMNPRTGVPYGVVSLNSLAEWAWDELTDCDHSTNLTAEAAFEEWRKENPEEDDWVFWEGVYHAEEEEYEYERDGLRLGLSWLGGAPLVWVYESPVIEAARPCSPCVPGAMDLDNRDPGGFDCYSLPKEWWFDHEDAG